MRSPDGQPAVPAGAGPTSGSRSGRTSGSGPSCRCAWPARAGRQRRRDLRSGHHADAQLRLRSDAARAAVPGRRCGAHRSAHRGQGAQPRGQRRAAAGRRRWRCTTATGDAAGLDAYSAAALRRVWRAQDFSNYMTQLLHVVGGGGFEDRAAALAPGVPVALARRRRRAWPRTTPGWRRRRSSRGAWGGCNGDRRRPKREPDPLAALISILPGGQRNGQAGGRGR